MPEFNDWFPTSRYGNQAINVMDFGAIANGLSNSMSFLGYSTPAEAQAAGYTECTDVDLDTADWCALTAAYKAAFTTGGVPHNNDGHLNHPLYIPAGRYITRKRLEWVGISGGWIYGDGTGTIITNETGGSDQFCVFTDGFRFCRVENLTFTTEANDGRAGNVAFELDASGDAPGGGVIATHGNLFINCDFSAKGGVACRIGTSGTLGSEMTFIKCNAHICSVGFLINGANALNYNFLACGGTSCTLNWIRVNTGGMVVVQNASLADNGTDPDGFDIYNGSGNVVVLGTRTECKRFVYGTAMTIIGCQQNTNGGNDNIFVHGGPAIISNCGSYSGRLCGDGPMHFDSTNVFNSVRAIITSVTNNGSGAVRITHEDSYAAGVDYFLDGDSATVQFLTSTGAGANATNGDWVITKISSTQVDLIGSTFIADTYNYSSASIGPGPEYHRRDITSPVPTGTAVMQVTPSRLPAVTKRFGHIVTWLDSGTTFDNLGATAESVFTLPRITWPSYSDVRGMYFRFIVLTNQSIKVQVNADPDAGVNAPRIFRALPPNNYAAAGTSISSNVVGSAIEIYLADGRGSNSIENLFGHRWLVRTETGTWTIAGTPAP